MNRTEHNRTNFISRKLQFLVIDHIIYKSILKFHSVINSSKGWVTEYKEYWMNLNRQI